MPKASGILPAVCVAAALVGAALLGGLATLSTDSQERPEAQGYDVERLAKVIEPGEVLGHLKAYRYRETVRNDYVDRNDDDSVQVFEGAFVAPDRAEVRWWPQTEGTGSQQPVATVLVGNRRWVDYGGGWQQGWADREAAEFGPADHLWDFEVDLQGLQPVGETVNGVASLRYDLAGINVKQLGTISLLTGLIDRMDFRFEAQLWLAEDGGWPVRLVLSVPADDDGRDIRFEYSMDITNVNDPTVTIEPPVP